MEDRARRWNERLLVPFESALESRLLSRHCEVGESEHGHDCQRETGRKTLTLHDISSFWFAIQWKDIVPSAQTVRRGGAGPVSVLLDGWGLAGRFSLRDRSST